MRSTIHALALLLCLAGCSSNPATTPSSSSSPAGGSPPTSASANPGSTGGLNAAAFDGINLKVDGKATTVQSSLLTQTQGAGAATTYVYLLGFTARTSGGSVAIGDWGITVGYSKASNTTTLTVGLAQRTGSAAAQVDTFDFLSTKPDNGANPYIMPTGATATASEDGGKLTVHVTGHAKSVLSSTEHDFDLTVTGLPLSS